MRAILLIILVMVGLPAMALMNTGESAMALIDYQNLVTKLAPDDAGHLDVDDRDNAIAVALARYSKDKPRGVVEDVAALGGYYLPLPQAWDDELSKVIQLEYPLGNMPPALSR